MLFFFFYSFTRLNILQSILKMLTFQKLSKFFLTQVIFLLSVMLITLNYILDCDQELIYTTVFSPLSFNKALHSSALLLN